MLESSSRHEQGSPFLKEVAHDMAPAGLDLYYPDGDAACFWQKVRTSDLYEADRREIQAEGQRLLGLPLPVLTYSLYADFARTGRRLGYERVYFERRRRLNTFAILTMLEPERNEYREALCDTLWLILEEYTWCLPAHLGEGDAGGEIDLFSAETGFALSELLYLAGDDLPPLIRSRIRDEVHRRLFEPYLAREFHWESAVHNWSAVCAGSIGAAALLLMEDADRLAAVLAKAERSMNCYLTGFGEDGACQEGLGYWNYGFGYFTYYADLLRKRSRGRLDWFASDKVRRIALFQQKCFLGGSAVANFSDSRPSGSIQPGLSDYLAGLYPEFQRPPARLRAAFTEDHCSRWAPAIRNLLWRSGEPAQSEWGPFFGYLPDAQWLIWRHAGPSCAFGFAAKGGHNAEPHNHNDLGQFMLYGDGEFFLADLGSGEYTKSYFGPERYTYDCNGSQGHSVPIVGGQYQAEGEDSRAVVEEAYADEAGALFGLDLTQAYRYAGLESLRRALRWEMQGGLPSLALTDEYRFAGAPNSVVERFVTRVRPRLAGDRIELQGSGEQGLKLIIHYDGGMLSPEITRRMFMDHDGCEAEWYTIDLTVRKPEPSIRVAVTFEFEPNDKESGDRE